MCSCSPTPVKKSSLSYPATRKDAVVEDLHGTPVADPYRWLEDDNAPETKSWVEAQNQVTFRYLESIPQRNAISNRLTQLWNFERWGTPTRRGDRYFVSRNNGLQNQAVVYSMGTLDGEMQELLDPNKLSSDGTVALAGAALSDDGKRFAYGIARSGSDWQEWRVREVATGKDLPDFVNWVKFSAASWAKDGSGFFYSRYDEPKQDEKLTKANYFHKLYFHRLGTPQSSDTLIYQRADKKEWNFNGTVTDDGRYLVITATEGTDPRNRVLYKDLSAPGGKVTELLMDFDADYTFLDNDGPVFWFRTDLDAPRARVIAIDVTRPERSNWREIIPQSEDTLTGVSVIGNRFVCAYLKDARSVVRVHALDGRRERDVELPGIGTVSGFEGKRDQQETFYSFTGFTMPGTVFRYDLATGVSTLWRQPKVDFDSSKYETKQVFYTSKDGTRIPMFITHRKGLKLNGRNPTYLYGYGGFNISITPTFSVPNAAWMEMGGVYAVPNLRGGGEYGEAWHKAGTKLQKQNVFDDFIAAAEWLIANHYTSPAKLAIGGGSNGGLLVGACMTQRPDLFAAALPAVGVMDMLRFHKFTIGWAWTSDYGSSENADEFKALLAYSPYHNLKKGARYPSTLVTTADHDDRVVPAHSFKFAARLQESHTGPNPVLIRIDAKAGHGAGKPTTKLIAEAADRWAFLVRELGMRM
ncbi:MAG: S9 family peptidase [Verrucomicrobiales bacterium]|nr:S9 family peptidase [Verrucomicrobiales bacterium]